MTLDVWDALTVISKAALYAATFAAAGGAAFLVYAAPLAQEQRRRIARGVYACALAALALSAVRLAVMAAVMSGEISGLWDLGMIRMALDSGEGRAVLFRLVGLTLIVGLVERAGRQTRADRGSGVGLGIGAVMAATSFAWVGHVHAARLAGAAHVVALAVLCLHLLCVAFWAGALPPLYVLSRELGALELGRQAMRFSVIAVRGVALLLAAGVGLAVLLLTPWSAAAWPNDYGNLLLVKLVGVALLLALAAYNRQRLTPRLRRGESDAPARLRRSIAVEIGVAVFVLVITAALTALTGPPHTNDNQLQPVTTTSGVDP